MPLNLILLLLNPLLLHRSSHPGGEIRHSDGFLCLLYLIYIEQMTQKIFKNFFVMDFKEFFSRHAPKLTPISPISWLYTAIRKSGVNMGELDKSVQTLGTDILGSSFGTNLTSAQREANAFSASEAEKNRLFQQDLSNTTYQRTVEDMKAAGLNPAVMLAGGANGVSTPSGSTASSVAPSNGLNLSDLLGLIMLPTQIKNINANTRNINERTNTQEQVTRIQRIAADYGVQYTEAQISQMLASAADSVASASLKQSNENLIKTQAEAQSIVNQYLDERQREEINNIKASSKNMEESAKQSKAQAWYTGVQAEFADKNGFLMSNSDMLLVATYIADLFNIEKKDIQSLISSFKPKPKNKGGSR